MEFTPESDDSSGAGKKKPEIVYTPEIQRKLDEALAIAETAKTEKDRIAALKRYQELITVEGEEQKERMRLVDFRGEKIHDFELQALQKIV